MVHRWDLLDSEKCKRCHGIGETGGDEGREGNCGRCKGTGKEPTKKVNEIIDKEE